MNYEYLFFKLSLGWVVFILVLLIFSLAASAEVGCVQNRARETFKNSRFFIGFRTSFFTPVHTGLIYHKAQFSLVIIFCLDSRDKGLNRTLPIKPSNVFLLIFYFRKNKMSANSVKMFSGYDMDSRTSSKVLRPPGGGYTDIFGIKDIQGNV